MNTIITDWDKNRYLKLMAQADGEDLTNGNITFDDFVEHLIHAIDSFIFRKFEISLPDAMRDYCHFAYVDPALVEVYIGQRFDNINFQPFIDKAKARTTSESYNDD